MGSRAVVAVCRASDAAERRFGAPGGALGAVYTRTGPAVLRPAADRAARLTGCAPRRKRRPVRRARHRLAAARRRDPAVEREGAGPAASTSTPRSVRRRARRCPRPSRLLEQAPAAGVDVAHAARPHRVSARRTPRPSPTPTAATAGRPMASTEFSVAPFQILAAEGRNLSRPAARLAPRSHRPAGRRRPGVAAPDAAPRRRHHRPGFRGSGNRLVGRADRCRR